MCDETTSETHDRALAARGLSRREFAALGAAVALGACASNGSERPGEQELTERTVRITTPDGIADAFFVHPAKGKWPGVIMWPDIAGVRELWLIDIPSGVVTIYRQQDARFAPPEIRRAEGRTEVAALSGLTLDLDFMIALRAQDEPF